MKLTIKKRVFNDVYYPYLWDTTRYLHFYGSAGSGKSYTVAQILILRSFKTSHDTLVVRKVEKTLKESVFKLIIEVINKWKLQDYFEVTKQPAVIRNTQTGHRFVFTGLDDPEKIKSIAGIQKIWIEEATELKLDDYLELDRRLRGLRDHQIIFTYNPIDENHWIKKEFHNKEVENCKILKTTYLDNKFVDQTYADTLNRIKEIDENQWRIYALGEWGVLNLNHKFDVKRLSQIEIKEPISISRGVYFYQLPEKKIYSMGIDSSRGRQEGDYTAISLRDQDYNQIAIYKGKADEQLTFDIAYWLASYYNQTGKVYITPEVNNMGIYLVNKFKESDYPDDLQYKRYITDPTKQLDGTIPDYGFVTSTKTRPIMINKHAELFNLGNLPVIDKELQKEMMAFIWNSKNNRYEAQEGSHDDLVFADMLAMQGFDYINQYG